MDIQFNNKQSFSLSFKQYNTEWMKVTFLENEIEMYNSTPCIVITENINTKLKFTSPDYSTKLYMDGIDTLPENMVKQDEDDNAYLSPSEKFIDIFTNQYYPLIPGIYRIIVVQNQRKYYSLIEIRPKLLSQGEWVRIREDLENEIRGLATQLIRRNISIVNEYGEYVPPQYLSKYYLIKQNFSKIMAALMDIRVKPNHRIVKTYDIIPENKLKVIDDKTVRSYLNNATNRGYIKAPTRSLTYDLPENRWLKKIVTELIKWLEEFFLVTERFIEKEKNIISEVEVRKNDCKNLVFVKEHNKVVSFLNELEENAYKMSKALNILMTSEWYKSVTNTSIKFIPNVMHSDARYNCLYKLYKSLKYDGCKIKIDDKFAFQWKSTDKLYETWGYIKICKIINEIEGFNACGGWLFSEKVKKNEILIPDLEPGMRIGFINKDNILINLIYDCKLPHYSNKTSLSDTPLYVKGNNNRPDARVDVYKNSIYIGSILIDFKYRPRKNIWDEQLINRQSNVMKQITAYETQCASTYLYGGRDSKHKRNPNPVFEVWVIHPNGIEGNNMVEEEEDRNLKFIELRPGKGRDGIEHSFRSVLKTMLEEASEDV